MQLDLADRSLRAEARKQGWTQPRAIGRAARSLVRGHVVAAAPDHLPSKQLLKKTPCVEVFWAVKRRKLALLPGASCDLT